MSELTPEQQAMVDLWEQHLVYEFTDHDPDKTVSTMVEDAYVNHVPTMIGGSTREGLRQFYRNHFVNQVPPDWTITPVSRTVGRDLLVDEMINEFTHTNEMDWICVRVALLVALPAGARNPRPRYLRDERHVRDDGAAGEREGCLARGADGRRLRDAQTPLREVDHAGGNQRAQALRQPPRENCAESMDI